MGWVYPVTFPDGKVRKALVSRVERSTNGCVIDGECFLYGCTEYGVVRHKNVVYHVIRRQRYFSEPWTPWTVSSVLSTRTRRLRSPFAPEAIEEAVRIARQEPRTASTLARILDGKTFGWDDARAWQYLTHVEPVGDVTAHLWKAGPDRWWIHRGIEEAVALARMALRRVDGNFDPPPVREDPHAALEQALWESLQRSRGVK